MGKRFRSSLVLVDVLFFFVGVGRVGLRFDGFVQMQNETGIRASPVI